MTWQVWQHKKTRKRFRVLPWWECLEPILTDADLPKELADRKVKIGSLVQIGWLLENEHGICIGTHPKAIEQFKVIKKAALQKGKKK